MSLRSLTIAALAPLLALGLTACAASGATDDATSGTRPDRSSDVTSSSRADADPNVVADEPFPEARCAANAAAGTITFLAGTDPAAASTIQAVLAETEGYYETMCLDVEIRPGSVVPSQEQVASGEAQFASAATFADMVAGAERTSTDLVAATVDGRSPIDTLIVESGRATELTDLVGAAIGTDAPLPPSIQVMLASAGLVDGKNYSTSLVSGEDPVAQISADDIDAIPGGKSTTVGMLAGVGVQQFDPLDYGVAGSFGVIYTTQRFIDAHPTAAQDFVRGTLRGLADAVAAPDRAVRTSTGASSAPDAELFRWETESDLILTGTPEGVGLGTPDPDLLQDELDAAASVGFLPRGEVPRAEDYVADGLARSVYSDETSFGLPDAPVRSRARRSAASAHSRRRHGAVRSERRPRRTCAPSGGSG